MRLAMLGAYVRTFWKNTRRKASMRSIDVRLGALGDVDDAASVYERSNLARRQGHWPSRPARVAQVTASFHDAAGHDASRFLIGRDGTEAVAMALVHPFRTDGGSGHVIAGGSSYAARSGRQGTSGAPRTKTRL